MILLDVAAMVGDATDNGPSTTVWLVILGGFSTGIGTVFAAYTLARKALEEALKERSKRCEAREDKLLADGSAQAQTIRELNAAILRATDLTEQSVNASTGAINASQRNTDKLDALSQSVSELRTAVLGLQQRLDSTTRASTSRTQRSG